VTRRRDCTGSAEGWRAGRDWLRERFAGCETALSHGRTSQCRDNAVAGSFCASIKAELPGLQPWPARGTARCAVAEYIAWYYGTRLQNTLGYRSPAEYDEDG
jgi:hypothetical protein